MYEEILRGGNTSFFTVLGRKSIKKTKRRNYNNNVILSSLDLNMPESIEKENEWQQEYFIIYNSYILENKEEN